MADKSLLYISVEKWHHFIFFSPIPTHRKECWRVVQKCFNCTIIHFWSTQKTTILKHSFPIIFSISHKYVRILALVICKYPRTKKNWVLSFPAAYSKKSNYSNNIQINAMMFNLVMLKMNILFTCIKWPYDIFEDHKDM